MIVFIGCGKKKSDVPCEAQYMYQGTFFKTCLAYAKTLSDNIYILSAKYGILKLTDKIQPYNLTLNTMTDKERTAWAIKVENQLKSYNIDCSDSVTFLCGFNYYEKLLHNFPNYSLPLQNFKGIGYQLSYMKSQLEISTNNSIKIINLWEINN